MKLDPVANGQRASLEYQILAASLHLKEQEYLHSYWQRQSSEASRYRPHYPAQFALDALQESQESQRRSSQTWQYRPQHPAHSQQESENPQWQASQAMRSGPLQPAQLDAVQETNKAQWEESQLATASRRRGPPHPAQLGSLQETEHYQKQASPSFGSHTSRPPPPAFFMTSTLGSVNVKTLIWYGLEEETRAVYEAAITSYLQFCTKMQRLPWPATVEALSGWLMNCLHGGLICQIPRVTPRTPLLFIYRP